MTKYNPWLKKIITKAMNNYAELFVLQMLSHMHLKNFFLSDYCISNPRSIKYRNCFLSMYIDLETGNKGNYLNKFKLKYICDLLFNYSYFQQ